ncbi:glycosyl transferase family 2 [Microbacterium testaceum]|uniref:glycosyltransferase family 2 protein n=1 Tax=Microbacterium testaceum TaxID=2033 RepID=UPI00073409F2|nr:glycosyltransferase family 2 protein [Microbacterium testaceum]KTS91425.1 glycosyl transferase family 2 [Microbacterium testaceum]
MPERPPHPVVGVSVVIPVRNDGPHLWRCLRALAAQTLAADEIVVVDNGSTDDSADIARATGARVVFCGERGIPAAASTGYDAARGELILRLDADSLPAPTWIASMVQALADPEVDAVTGGAVFHDGPASRRVLMARVFLGTYNTFAFPALGHTPLWGSNMAFRRAAWEAVRDRVHLDPELHDDLDLAYHLGVDHRIRYVPGRHMRVSSRTVEPRRFARCFRRGAGTVFAHWPADVPPVRWARVARARRRAARAGVGR